MNIRRDLYMVKEDHMPKDKKTIMQCKQINNDINKYQYNMICYAETGHWMDSTIPYMNIIMNYVKIHS